jgi:hypothetical protein
VSDIISILNISEFIWRHSELLGCYVYKSNFRGDRDTNNILGNRYFLSKKLKWKTRQIGEISYMISDYVHYSERDTL